MVVLNWRSQAEESSSGPVLSAAEWALVIGLALVFSYISITTRFQELWDWTAGGSLMNMQLGVMDGSVDEPFVFRILTYVMAAGVWNLAGALQLPYAELHGYILFRALIDFSTAIMLVLYYRKLGLSFTGALLGVTLTLWAYSATRIEHGFSYTNVLIFAIGGWLIAARRSRWLPVLMVFASLNRETTGVIPVMLAFSALEIDLKERRIHIDREPFIASVVSLAVFAAVYLIMRQLRGTVHHPPGGIPLGIPLLLYNLSNPLGWRAVMATVTLMPFVGLLAYARSGRLLQSFFWAVLPVWLPFHYMFGFVDESRYFLEPLIIVLIPMALRAAGALGGQAEEPGPGPALGFGMGAALLAAGAALWVNWAGFIPEQYNNNQPWPSTWTARYYANESLRGLPLRIQQHAALTFDWTQYGTRPFYRQLQPGEGFSARFERREHFEEGSYIFALSPADGLRLSLNGELLIDQWETGSSEWINLPVDMEAGDYDIRIEYRADGEGDTMFQAGSYPAP